MDKSICKSGNTNLENVNQISSENNFNYESNNFSQNKEGTKSVDFDSQLLLDEIASLEDHFNTIIKSSEVEKKIDENLKASSEKTNTLQLKDPPDIEEILATPEEIIPANSHNVTVINVACQEILRKMECILINLLKKNRKEQEIVLNYLNPKSKVKDTEVVKKINFKCMGIPYFRDSEGYFPPFNEDVLKKKKQNKLLPVDFIKGNTFWTYKDAKTLISAVQANNKSENNLIDPQNIDWMKISAHNMDGKYSPSECKSKWILNLSPNINKSMWKVKELKILNLIAKKYNYQNWEAIAHELGTNRSALQCCVKYQTHKTSVSVRWTDKEDEALKNVIEKFRIKDHIPWKKVAWYYKSRSLRQCQERYIYHLVDIKKGQFSPEEDYVLIYLASKLKNFGEIAKYLPHRVCPQLRARYSYLVKQTMPQFSKEEDELLTQLMIKYPRNWKKISEFFEGRSRLQCRGRWDDIQKKISINNDSSDESESENCSDLDQRRISTESLGDTHDTRNLVKKLNYLVAEVKNNTKRKKISKEYKNLLNYCKCGYKFLFGPKQRLPRDAEEKHFWCSKMKITMKNLSVNPKQYLGAYDIDSLRDNCEFECEDLTILSQIKNSFDSTNSDELSRTIIPPNFITLIGLRTLFLSLNNIKNLCIYHNPIDSSQFKWNNDTLFTDAKQLFKARLKTIFAFPLILSEISQEGMNVTAAHKPKVRKQVKPLSKLKRKNHAKLMSQAYRKKLEASLNSKMKDSAETTTLDNAKSKLSDISEKEKESENLVESTNGKGSGRKRGRPRKRIVIETVESIESSPKKSRLK